MKILTWTAGAVFFLGVALTTYLLIDGEGATRLIDSIIPLGAAGPDANAFAKALRLIKTNFLFYAAVTLAAGFLWASLAGRGRPRFPGLRRLAASDGSRSGRAGQQAQNPHQDFLNQLEVNWKTFASYTQDLLHRKIKELEEAPQKALKEMAGQAAALWKALEEVKRSVALARGELKETAQGIQERIGVALGEATRKKDHPPAAGPAVEPVLRQVEKRLSESGERFSRIEDRIARLVESLEADRKRPVPASMGEFPWKKVHDDLNATLEAKIARLVESIEADRRRPAPAAAGEIPWKKIQEDLGGSVARSARLEERVGALLDFLEEGRRQAVDRRVEKFKQESLARIASLTTGVEEAKKEKDRLQSEVARAREAESSLRADLGTAAVKAKEQAKLLDEAGAREEKGSRRVQELSSEGDRLRRDLERTKAEALARASSLTGELDRARRELEGLRGEASRAREAETAVRAELEKAAVREKEHAKRLEEAARREEIDSRKVKDLSNDLDRLRSESDRKEKGHEEERTRLSAEIAELSAQGSQLESDMGEALSGTERLQGLLQSRDAELAGLRASMEALRVDKERLAEDARRLGEDVKALRAGKVDAEKKRLKDLMDENSSLRREVKTAREALEERKSDGGSRREGPSHEEVQSLRRELEAERSGKGSRIQELEAETKQLREELGDADVKWVARVTELESKLSEAEETERNLVARAEEAERRPPAEPAGEAAAQDSALRLGQLEREKTELVASLNRVGEELERLRADIDGFRRFQGALIQGSIPAAIVAADASLKVFAWNPAAESLWGIEANAVLGKLLPAIGVKGLDGEIIEQARLAMEERRSITLPQSSFADARGSSRHVRWTCDPVLGPDGDSLGVVIIAEDLTEEVERQIESRLQSLFNQSLLRSIPAGVVVLDPQRRVISWNRKAEAILGISETEAIGQDFFSLRIPLAKSAFQKRFEESQRDGAVHRLRVRFEVNGLPVNHVVTQAPFYGGDDSVRGSMLLLEANPEPEMAGGR